MVRALKETIASKKNTLGVLINLKPKCFSNARAIKKLHFIEIKYAARVGRNGG